MQASPIGIQVRGLSRRFGDKLAVAGFELDVRAGVVTGLLGPNGSGKSTLLRMLVGLVRPNSGSASVAGATLAGDGIAVRRRASYAPGEIALYGEMNADEHLRWLLRGRPPAAVARARGLAQTLGLPLTKRVRAFSHGMKRQLLFVAALAPDVPVRILDEPSEGLDPHKRGELLELLRAQAAEGRTVLISSHHLGEVDRVCDDLVFLNQGQLVRSGPASEVRAHAARLVRVQFGPQRDEGAFVRALERLPARTVRRDGGRVVLELPSEDSRPLLSALAGGELGPPLSLVFGEASLSDLYHDLYGVEAC